jgi:uncharacterized protein YfaQ (DUF2300 family)
VSISLLLAAALAAAPADDLAVAWLRDGRVETRLASPAASARGVPLGSAWKVFVYAYAVDRGLDTPDYRCGTPRRKDEEYCCEAGGSVGRDRALAQSCGLFFAPSRLGVDAASWRAYWQGRTDDAASWLDDLDALKPETRVDASALLHARGVPPQGREAALRALLPVAVETQGVAAQLGGSVRVKTFTWANPRRGGASIGGGAGWLADGTPVWFAASGSSRQVLQREAPRLAAWLPPLREASGGDACVIVDYFARYAIRSVDRLPVGVRAADGALDGLYRVLFENGNALTLTATGELRLDHDGAHHPHLRGRLSLTEYVARVLDREADRTSPRRRRRWPWPRATGWSRTPRSRRAAGTSRTARACSASAPVPRRRRPVTCRCSRAASSCRAHTSATSATARSRACSRG